jgi:uncharacterized repeat protein (TIGR03803 family)
MSYKATTSKMMQGYLQLCATLTQRCPASPALQGLVARMILLTALYVCSSTVIRADLPGIQIDTVHGFQVNEGRSRASLILAPDGKLYGTTDCKKDRKTNRIVFGGIVYQLDPSTWALERMYPFSLPDNLGRNADGACPIATLSIGADGLLYGTTEFGGLAGSGTLFRFDPASRTFTVLHNFGTGGDQLAGAHPLGAAVPDGHGNLYGATHSGVIYKWDGSSIAIVYGFKGVSLYGSPIFGADGKLYGSTYNGGANNRGIVYSLDPATGNLRDIFDFQDYTFAGNGDNTPVQSLFLASNGDLYGTTEFGGLSGNGLMWKVSGGVFAVLHNFSSYGPGFTNGDGGQPTSTLTEGADGMIYGTTFYGGAYGAGTIFRIGKDSTVLESMYSFDPAHDPVLGGHPYSGLTPMPDGSMIGTTWLPGAVYRVTLPLSVSIRPAPITATRIGRGIVSAAATAVPLNGEAPFSYSWSVDVGTFTIHTPGDQTTTVSAALAACDSAEGTLSVTVTDALGRTANASTSVTFSVRKPPGGFCD